MLARTTKRVCRYALRSSSAVAVSQPRTGFENNYSAHVVVVGVLTAGAATAAACAPEQAPEEKRHVATPTFERRPSVLFVLGGPGAGKGTQCARLVKECGFVHLSAGDLLRAERKSGSPDGELISRYIKEGQIVPVEITVGLLGKAMMAAGRRKFLIDGFPRNEDNLEGWQRVMGDSVDVDGVLFYDVADDVRLERLLERGKTSGRTDDNAETIRKRFQVFYDQTMPIVKHYEEQGRTHHIDGAPSPDVVFEASLRAVTPTLERDVVAATETLLAAVDTGDWETYASLCDDRMTAVEEESGMAVVEGLEFHKFYFDEAAKHAPGSAGGPTRRSAVLSPSVRLLGPGSAVVAYTRAVQSASGPSKLYAETRAFTQRDGEWICAHFHRTPLPAPAGAAHGSAAAEAFAAEAEAVEAELYEAVKSLAAGNSRRQ